MQIKVSFVGYLKVDGVQSGSRIAVDDGTTVADLLAKFRVSPQHQRFVVPVVNGREQRRSYVLQADDELSLFLPVGGG